MVENLDKLVDDAQQAIGSAEQIDALEQIRVQYLGKKGAITALMKELGKLSAEERPKAGQVINQAKQSVQQAIQAKKTALQDSALAEKLRSETIDVTLPGRGERIGGLHPVSRTRNQ